jgi:hypothetical protein
MGTHGAMIRFTCEYFKFVVRNLKDEKIHLRNILNRESPISCNICDVAGSRW